MGPYIRGAGAPSAGDPLLGIIWLLIWVTWSKKIVRFYIAETYKVSVSRKVLFYEDFQNILLILTIEQ